MANLNRGLVFFLSISLTFLLTNFNHPLATSYSVISIFTLILMLIDNKLSINLNLSKSNLGTDAIVGIAGYAVFLVISVTILSFLTTLVNVFGLNAIINLMAEVQPIFAGSVLFSFTTFGILIPIVENSFFFGVVMEYISDKLHISITLKSARSQILYILVGAIFAFFHATAKGLPKTLGGVVNNPALLVTFLFGYIMCVMVAFEKDRTGRAELRPATFGHIVANILAISRKLGIGGI